MSEKKIVTIDVTPTWRAVLPILLEVAERGTTKEGREEARKELERMADLADEYVKLMKKK